MINNFIFWMVLILLAIYAFERFAASEEAAQEVCQAKQKVAVYSNGDWYCVPGEKL